MFGSIFCSAEMPTMALCRRRVWDKEWRGAGEASRAHSSGQRWLPAIHLWFQDSESADRSESPGTGLWAVTTDTQTNQGLSLKQYQLDGVTGDGKTG